MCLQRLEYRGVCQRFRVDEAFGQNLILDHAFGLRLVHGLCFHIVRRLC
jgi:hypothetical protein